MISPKKAGGERKAGSARAHPPHFLSGQEAETAQNHRNPAVAVAKPAASPAASVPQCPQQGRGFN